MEGSVLSFLKAEWKVSDTGSAHWASSLRKKYLVLHRSFNLCKFLYPVYISMTEWPYFIAWTKITKICLLFFFGFF
jgi:hypothetical protein